jgi:putative addiction module component (TIGR02574 family)
MTKSHLLTEILRLRPQDRQALIRDAIDSLPEEYAIDPDLTPEQSAELDRRLDDYIKDPSKGKSWEQVNARVHAKIREINAKRTSHPEAQST